MIHKLFKSLIFTVLIVGFIACNKSSDSAVESKRYQFSKILDIAYTPNSETSSDGWFADAGSWVGYTIPEDQNWVNGLKRRCLFGHFIIDRNSCQLVI